MTNGSYIRWDIKRGYSVYQSVDTKILQKWIRERRVNKGDVLVWTSGMSGWRRPEELDEFRRVFRKISEKKKKRIEKKVIVPVTKKRKKSRDVIIIDDEKEICWLLGNVLKKRRFNVSSANSGREGLNLIKDKGLKRGTVLLDLKLGDVDGLNVLRKIKELWPGIKVVIISAFGGPLVKEKASSLGADGFVDKPFKPEDIVKTIKKI